MKFKQEFIEAYVSLLHLFFETQVQQSKEIKSKDTSESIFASSIAKISTCWFVMHSRNSSTVYVLVGYLY